MQIGCKSDEDECSVISEPNGLVADNYFKREFVEVLEEPIDDVDTNSLEGCLR